MKVQLCSDLHLEHYPSDINFDQLLTPSAPYLCVSGDLCPTNHPNFKRFFDYFSSKFQKIFYVAGNHEFYNVIFERTTYQEFLKKAIDLCSTYDNVFFLNNRHHIIDDNTVIYGSTLWTQIPDIANETITKLLTSFMNDYHKIFVSSEANFSVFYSNYLFNHNVKKLKIFLEKFKDKTVIIMTHHLPSYQLIHDKYKGHIANCCFASDLDNLIINNSQIKYWLCGHTHTSMNIQIGNTKILVNPHGYKDENPDYKTDFTFEIN